MTVNRKPMDSLSFETQSFIVLRRKCIVQREVLPRSTPLSTSSLWRVLSYTVPGTGQQIPQFVRVLDDVGRDVDGRLAPVISSASSQTCRLCAGGLPLGQHNSTRTSAQDSRDETHLVEKVPVGVGLGEHREHVQSATDRVLYPRGAEERGGTRSEAVDVRVARRFGDKVGQAAEAPAAERERRSVRGSARKKQGRG